MAKEQRRKYDDDMARCLRNQPRPKHVSGAYQFFRMQKKKDYKADYPDLDKKRLQKVMVRDWYMMTNQEKEPYR